MIGYWQPIKKNSKSTNAKSWSFIPYEKNTIIEYKGYYYKGLDEKNAADPSDNNSRVLYVSFFVFEISVLLPILESLYKPKKILF